jgi:hypothetical protein
MGESIITRKGGSGLNVQEVLKTFTVASGQTITAGTFVDYIQGSNFDVNNENISHIGNTSFLRTCNVGNDKVVSNSQSSGIKLGIINGTSISWSSANIFFSPWENSISALGTDKAVFAYRNNPNAALNPNYGIARIGTISGASITIGSESIFNNSAIGANDVTALGTDKIVVVYSNETNSGYGTAKVGTVSGTSISWGSAFVFNSASTFAFSITPLGIDKIIVAYADNGNANRGTARIGTVSGTSITWGSAFVFNNASTTVTSVTALGTDKIVVAYRDQGNLGYGTAIVGTISGTSISWGSEFVFNPASTFFTSVASFGTDKIVVAYRDDGNSSYGTVIVGTISGTSITWGSELVYNTVTTHSNDIKNIENGKVLIGYNHNFQYTAVKILTLKKEITNTTAEKVFGLAKTGGTAGQTIEVYTNT